MHQKKTGQESPLSRWARFTRPLQQIAHSIRLRHWFPHFPLALAVAFSGAVLLWIVFAVQRSVLLRDFPMHIVDFQPRSMPFVLIGVAMLIMSVGLLLRSRFAWIIAILLSAFTVLSALTMGHEHHRELIFYDGILLVVLLLAYRKFNRSSLAAGTLFALTSVLLLLIYGVFGSLYLGSQFSPPIKGLVNAFYFTVVTMTTMGYYGVPSSAEASMFTVSVVILGIGVFATSLTTIVGPVIARLTTQKEKRMTRSGHFIVIGATPLAYNTYRELKKRKKDVVVILQHAPESDEIDPADVIVGDAANLDTLRRANADQAQAVLAMRADDSDNAFIVLAVKELKGRAKTVVAINDSKHMGRVRLVQPDMIIAPEVLGGELLAMTLNGERISGDFLMQRFLNFDQKPSGSAS
ncbi:MAG: NAD-binding protein [Candidatus Acidiferrales bacterium]